MSRGFQKLGACSKHILAFAGLFLLVASASAQIVPKEALGKMGSEKFKVREQGYADLKKWASNNTKKSPEALYKTWVNENDPEVKTRCFSVMKEMVILREFGRGPGFVGVRMEDVLLPGPKADEPGIKGVRIVLVLANTPAERAGLSVGDVVLTIDKVDLNVIAVGGRLNSPSDIFVDHIKSKHPGDVITMSILRGGQKLDVNVTLMLRPDDEEIGQEPFWGRQAPVSRKKQGELFFSGWLKKMSR